MEGNQPLVESTATTADSFSHELFDRVFVTRVDEQERVDYTTLGIDFSDLDAYYLQISLISPDSHPDLFPTRNDRLP